MTTEQEIQDGEIERRGLRLKGALRFLESAYEEVEGARMVCGSRPLAVTQTKIDEAIMWLQKEYEKHGN